MYGWISQLLGTTIISLPWALLYSSKLGGSKTKYTALRGQYSQLHSFPLLLHFLLLQILLIKNSISVCLEAALSTHSPPLHHTQLHLCSVFTTNNCCSSQGEALRQDNSSTGAGHFVGSLTLHLYLCWTFKILRICSVPTKRSVYKLSFTLNGNKQSLIV